MVLSAKLRDCERFKQFSKSLKNIKNNGGPRIDPWGTPQVMFKSFESQFSTTQKCFLLKRLSANQLRESPVIPKLLSFSKRAE